MTWSGGWNKPEFSILKSEPFSAFRRASKYFSYWSERAFCLSLPTCFCLEQIPLLRTTPYLCSCQSAAASSSAAPASPALPSPWPAWLSSFSPPILFFCCFLLMPPASDESNVSVYPARKPQITRFTQILCLQAMRGKRTGIWPNTWSILRNPGGNTTQHIICTHEHYWSEQWKLK